MKLRVLYSKDVSTQAGGGPTGNCTMTRTTLPPHDEIRPNTPVRLSVAAALAFPDGSMTASGLRRERARGRLVVERIAGKDYTTLANIERMRELCRVHAKAPRLSLRPARRKAGRSSRTPSGSSSTATGISPRDALRARLNEAREAEKAPSGLHRRKVQATPQARDIDQIDIADVLSIYSTIAGHAWRTSQALERCIGRLNDYWGGKMLSEVTAAECRVYVASRKTGGARTDLETLRAAINHHAKENLHYGIVRVTLPTKGPPRDGG